MKTSSEDAKTKVVMNKLNGMGGGAFVGTRKHLGGYPSPTGSSGLRCPLCQSTRQSALLTLPCGNIDGSKLYPTIKLKGCLCCGHAFNDLSPGEISGLKDYYDLEYAATNVSSSNRQGDLPGSNGKLTRARYDQLFEMLVPHINAAHKILDVGCALGGFLHYLREKGFSHLSGVDSSKCYVELAESANLFRIERGSAECLPFDNQTFDVIVAEQVLEHLLYPRKALREARRVLKHHGWLCIGVPDASRYADFPFFDFYWLLLREHIQHFDIGHLNLLAKDEGFELVEYRRNSHAVMSDKMIMPNLCAVFRVNDSTPRRQNQATSKRELRRHLTDYISGETVKRAKRSSGLVQLAQGRRPVYAWGIGREFLYLYESAGFKYCNIVGLIDQNPYKQALQTVNGIRMVSPEDLLAADRDSLLLITAVAHAESIEHTLKSLGFRGRTFRMTTEDIISSDDCYGLGGYPET
jgi:SAM-dependent methyltransferase